MKRYAEAKPVYEEGLKLKPNVPLCMSKLAEIEKIIKKWSLMILKYSLYTRFLCYRKMDTLRVNELNKHSR